MNEYQFEYHFGGATWGVSIFADDPAQAREKIKAVGLAQYKGEIAARIPVGDGPTWGWVAAAMLAAVVLILAYATGQS